MPTHTSFREIRRKFDQIFIKLKIWRKYYICLCRGAAVTTGFAYAQKLVDRAAVGFLVIYFSNSWEKNKLSNAVAMVNVLEGLSSILVLAMTYMSENHVSPLKVILYSNAAYITGMVMLCISAFHPIPGDMSGMYFVPVVLLIAVGKAGGVPILEEFLVGQLAAHKPRELDRVNARKTVWWFTASLLCTLSTPLIFGNIAGWRATFMVSTSVMAIGCLLFWYFIPLYPRSVDKAATTSEISLASPEENTNNGPTPAVSTGRRLKEQWKPLSVMIPMWTTFLVFGLVLSTGDTFFAEQGNMMEGNEDPTVLIYVVDMIGMIVRATSSFFTAILLKYVPKRLNTLHIIVGIWIAMVLSVFCCSVAWSVEFRRLYAIEESGMNIMQLAPQYCLLGLMEGIGKQGLDLFFEVQVSGVPLEKYGSELNEAMIGFGSFINALLVFCLRSWFSDTLEDSIHLDNYYKMLMILSFVNLCYYSWLVPIYYVNKKQTKDDPDKIHGAVELITIGAKSRILTRANQISRRRYRDQDNTYLLKD